MRGEKKWILLILIFVITTGIILYNMLTWRDNSKVKFADSPSVNQKLKSAILGDGIIEFDEGEVNSLINTVIKSSAKIKGRVKESYINIIDDKIKVNAIASVYGVDFFVSSVVKPSIADKTVNLSIESIAVGKVPIPKSLALYFAKTYLPQDITVLEDGTINLGSKVAALDMKEISIGNGRVRIQLNDVEIGFKNNSNANPISSAQSSPVVNTANTPPPPKAGAVSQPKPESINPPKVEKPPAPGKITQPVVDPETQKIIDALKLTNSQMYNVLKEVKSTAGKNWVQNVINVNSKMINNPDGNYTGEINESKVVYSKLLPADKNEIKGAALDNMDVSSVRYLVKVYGIR